MYRHMLGDEEFRSFSSSLFSLAFIQIAPRIERMHLKKVFQSNLKIDRRN